MGRGPPRGGPFGPRTSVCGLLATVCPPRAPPPQGPRNRREPSRGEPSGGEPSRGEPSRGEPREMVPLASGGGACTATAGKGYNTRTAAGEKVCSLHLVPSGGRQHAKRRRRGGSQNAEMAPIAAQRLGKLCANVCFACFSGVVSRGSKTESAEQLALLRSRPGQPVATAAGLPRRGRAGASVNALGECHTHFLRRRLRLRFGRSRPRGGPSGP